MARSINRLMAIDVPRITREGLHNDGNGLYLKVTKSKSKSWVLKYGVGGKMRAMGLGSFPAISLAAARKLAAEQRQKLSGGIDPIESRKAAKTASPRSMAPTFRELADEVLARRQSTWRNPKSKRAWELTLVKYAKPLHKLPVDEVNTDTVLAVLKPHWASRRITANRLRQRIEIVWDYAQAKGLISMDRTNPARWKHHLQRLLPAKPPATHYKSMPYSQLPEFFARLRSVRSPLAHCMMFTILTVARSGESRLAVWSEIAGDIWEVPGNRTKTGKMHLVPLSAQAIEILDHMKRIRTCNYVFQGHRKGCPFSDAAFKRLGLDGFTPHGFRSTFRTWVDDETDFDESLAELALSHSIGNAVQKAYKRSTLIEKRRELMEAWGRFCTASAQSE